MRLIGIVGIGRENIPLARVLLARGAHLILRDKREEPPATLGELLVDPRVQYRLGERYLQDWEEEVVYLTPGIARDLPELEEARRRGVRFSSQMQLFLEECPAKVVGITGSSGKTTTTTLISEMIRASGRRVFLGGNIGRPLIEDLASMTAEDWVVLELSSFQLQDLTVSPHLAVITNITPNHLDIHKTMEAYIEAKAQILRHQGPGDLLVLNGDDLTTRRLAQQAKGEVHFFSRLGTGASAIMRGQEIVLNLSGASQVILRRDEVKLLGVHNLENILAAITAVGLVGVEPKTMAQVIRSFTGVPHRLELVKDTGVRYYNDSIATSPARAIAALRSFDAPMIWIAGGYDKKLPFDELAGEVMDRPIKAAILLGETAPLIEQTLHRANALRSGGMRAEATRPSPEIHRVETLQQAVVMARKLAQAGDVVLLSPACASYDMFNNFEERGEAFRRLVLEEL